MWTYCRLSPKHYSYFMGCHKLCPTLRNLQSRMDVYLLPQITEVALPLLISRCSIKWALLYYQPL
jgi:hypothetical protein